jgi:hypothetical protein
MGWFPRLNEIPETVVGFGRRAMNVPEGAADGLGVRQGGPGRSPRR